MVGSSPQYPTAFLSFSVLRVRGAPQFEFSFQLDNYKGAALIPMNTVVKIQPKDVGDIPFQEASFDIWDKKYRLTAKDGTPIDNSIEDTYKRVARALADVEAEECREQWYESFLWALRHGAIPAGRVTSNAG